MLASWDMHLRWALWRRCKLGNVMWSLTHCSYQVDNIDGKERHIGGDKADQGGDHHTRCEWRSRRPGQQLAVDNPWLPTRFRRHPAAKDSDQTGRRHHQCQPLKPSGRVELSSQAEQQTEEANKEHKNRQVGRDVRAIEHEYHGRLQGLWNRLKAWDSLGKGKIVIPDDTTHP